MSEAKTIVRVIIQVSHDPPRENEPREVIWEDDDFNHDESSLNFIENIQEYLMRIK